MVSGAPKQKAETHDAHTYRQDGWVVKNEPANARRWRSSGQDTVDLTPAGMEQAAFILLEMGHEAHAQRALAAGARYVTIVTTAHCTCTACEG